MSDNTVGVCCDMIVLHDNKVLMGKRGNVFGKGSWALPGGHLEYNEKTEDCVKRELNEEVGIIPDNMELVGVVNDIANLPEQNRHYVRFVYLINSFNGGISNKEPERCEGWEWFDVNDLPEPIFVGHVKPLELFKLRDQKHFLE